MKFNQLSEKAKENCLRLQKKYNFKNLTEDQIKVKINDWDFSRNGEMNISLTLKINK